MAEGYSTDQNPSMSMEELPIQHKTQEDADAMSRGLASLPMEMILQMVESLPPAHDTVQTGYAGSDASHSAQSGLEALRALCQVSKQMEIVAKPNLYRTIVVSDPHKLHRLRQTLENSPELGKHVKSLTVYRYFDASDIKNQRLLDQNCVPGNMTLSQFSESLVAVLEKTPNLVTLSLNLDRMREFRDSRPFTRLRELLHMDISRANNPNNPQGFLPNVVNLGILLPSGEASEIQRSEEYQIFNDLLNLPSLRHIVVRRPGLGPSPGCVIYGELLSQRKESLRHTIISIDLRVGRRMSWDDIGGINFMFPSLYSLVLSHRSHEPPRLEIPPGWTAGRIHMESLRHLSIDIASPRGWSHCEWFSNSIKSQFHFAPMLESLRIPMRLLRDPLDANCAKLHPSDVLNPREVLPRTLKSLVLIADLKVFPLRDADGENVAPVPEDYQDLPIPMPYPIARHMTIPWTIWFLEVIEDLCPTYFSQLNMLGLEYETSQMNDHGFSDVNRILDSSEEYFVSKVQALQGTMEQKGIHFSLTKL